MPQTRQLYLVRHAIAAERGDKWPDDTKRPLTHKGAARMRQAVEGLRALGVEIDLVLTSPLVRAEQTADILVQVSRREARARDRARARARRTPAAVAEAAGAARQARRSHRPRRPRARTSASSPPGSSARTQPLAIQEGRRLPHRRRRLAARAQQRTARLARDAEDAAGAR